MCCSFFFVQVIIANLLGISYGLVNFLAYLGFIFGEIDFYARLETSVARFEEEQERKVRTVRAATNMSEWMSEWHERYSRKKTIQCHWWKTLQRRNKSAYVSQLCFALFTYDSLRLSWGVVFDSGVSFGASFPVPCPSIIFPCSITVGRRRGVRRRQHLGRRVPRSPGLCLDGLLPHVRSHSFCGTSKNWETKALQTFANCLNWSLSPGQGLSLRHSHTFLALFACLISQAMYHVGRCKLPRSWRRMSWRRCWSFTCFRCGCQVSWFYLYCWNDFTSIHKFPSIHFFYIFIIVFYLNWTGIIYYQSLFAAFCKVLILINHGYFTFSLSFFYSTGPRHELPQRNGRILGRACCQQGHFAVKYESILCFIHSSCRVNAVKDFSIPSSVSVLFLIYFFTSVLSK